MIDSIKYLVGILLFDKLLRALFGQLNPKIRKIVLFPVIVLIFAITYTFFVTRTPDNYFKEFEVPRTFAQEGLKKHYRKLAYTYHPDKIRQSTNLTEEEINRKFDSIQSISELFKVEARREYYDKIGSIALRDLMEYKREEDVLARLEQEAESQFGSDMVFFIALLLILSSTGSDRTMGKYRPICIISCLLCIVFSYALLYETQSQEADFIDDIFPQMAIHERIYFGKIFVGVFLLALKMILKFRREKAEFYMLERLDAMNSQYKTLNKSIGNINDVKNAEKNSEIVKQIDKINEDIQALAKICEGINIEEKKEQQKKNRKRIKFALFIVIAFLLYNIFSTSRMSLSF